MNNNMKQNKIFQLITVSKSVSLLNGQIEYLRKNNINMHLISSDGKELEKYQEDIVIKVEMKRNISIINDLKALFKLIVLFLKEKPYIVNAGTPKAGLLGMVASFITRRPHRVYTVRGLRLETVTGIKFKILYLMERIAMYCATDIVAISESLKSRIIELNLNNNKNIIVFGNGSSNGINLSRFNKSETEIEKSISDRLKNKFVIGYIGRVSRDKGIQDLIKAYKQVESKNQNVILMIIGSIENEDPINKEDLAFITNSSSVIYIDHVSNPVNYYNNMDVFVFPTYREGFGNVSIEAQVLGVPTITYDVTGAKDTVLNNETGFIVKPGNYNEIVNKIELLMNDQFLRKKLSINSEKWVKENFSNEIIWKDMLRFYNSKLN